MAGADRRLVKSQQVPHVQGQDDSSEGVIRAGIGHARRRAAITNRVESTTSANTMEAAAT
jgi:hypothetical protein